MDKLDLYKVIAGIDDETVDRAIETEEKLKRRKSILKKRIITVSFLAATFLIIAGAVAAIFLNAGNRPDNQIVEGSQGQGGSTEVLVNGDPTPAPDPTVAPDSNVKYDIFITDLTDSSSLAGVQVDYYQLHSTSAKENYSLGEKTFTFGSLTFDGIPLEGVFGYAMRREYNTYDEYEYLDKETGAFFDVDKEGSLGFYLHSDDGSWEKITSDHLDDERTAAIAREFAGSFRNISGYEISAIRESSSKIKTVYFQKTVNGILTTDRFQVDVSYDSVVLGYSSFMTDKISADIKTDDINIESIDKAVSDYLKDIIEENNITEIQKTKTLLSLLEDGKRIIIEQYDMKVGSGDGHSECIEIMIVID